MAESESENTDEPEERLVSMTPAELANWDQNSRILADSLPTMWAAMYTNLIVRKVPPDHALEMVKEYIKK